MPLTWRDDRIAATAGEDLTDKEYHAGTLDANGDIVTAAAGTGLGVIIGNPRLGGDATLQVNNASRVVVGGPVSILDKLVVGADARYVVATAAGGEEIQGVALSETTNPQVGSMVTLLIAPNGVS